jgi:ATP-binding cassette subfamily B protein
MDAELKPIERKRSYFNRIFYLNDYAKEIRLNPVADQLKNEFSETNGKVYPIVDKYGKKNALAGFVEDYVSNDILINTVYLGYLVYQTVVKGALSYGSTMALFSASSSLKKSLRNMALMLPKFEQHGLYVEKIRTFLAAESNMESGERELEEGTFRELTVNGVSFAYGKDADTLHNINLSIKAGEKIAIVGYNGAGKTTLIKLLLRLYDVSQGQICLNGQDIREYDRKNYSSLFATVFQDYKIFASTIADNVKMDVAVKSDAEQIEQALVQSGFAKRLESLSQGIDTPLTREFEKEGVNLSGGEAQKVAIARTFYKYCPIIILDEPSSALDPISEYQLNQAMLEVAKDKTVIFISHRLSSTVMADRIYMLEQGNIIEQGNHKELLALGGKYAQMFRMQAEKYNISE